MKMSKTAKARLKRMTAGEKKACMKAARLLADCELITDARYVAIARTCA